MTAGGGGCSCSMQSQCMQNSIPSWWTNKASQVNLLKGGEEQPHFYGMRIEDSRLLFNLSAASCNRDKIGTIPKKKQEAELSLWSRKFSPSKWKKT